MKEKEATKKLAQTVRIKFCKTLESSQMFTTTRKNNDKRSCCTVVRAL